jgi:hypothetical protein
MNATFPISALDQTFYLEAGLLFTPVGLKISTPGWQEIAF